MKKTKFNDAGVVVAAVVSIVVFGALLFLSEAVVEVPSPHSRGFVLNGVSDVGKCRKMSGETCDSSTRGTCGSEAAIVAGIV